MIAALSTVLLCLYLIRNAACRSTFVIPPMPWLHCALTGVKQQPKVDIQSTRRLPTADCMTETLRRMIAVPILPATAVGAQE